METIAAEGTNWNQLNFDSLSIRTFETPYAERVRTSTNRNYIVRESRLFGSNYPKLEIDGLTKRGFFSENLSKIRNIVEAINSWFRLSPDIALSLGEVIGVCNAEMGLKSGGTIDPKHDHGANELGLLPLSSIHKYVTGSNAPDPFGLYEPTINFEEFLMYLGGLKTIKEYKSTYMYPGIRGQWEMQTHNAAAVVHGYFYSSNYLPKSSKPLNTVILNAIVDKTIGDVVSKSTFKAAFAVQNRISNINDGIALSKLLGSS